MICDYVIQKEIFSGRNKKDIINIYVYVAYVSYCRDIFNTIVHIEIGCTKCDYDFQTSMSGTWKPLNYEAHNRVIIFRVHLRGESSITNHRQHHSK